MISTYKYNISIVLDADDYPGRRKAIVYSAFTGQKLGSVNYDPVLESGCPEDIDNYISSNMRF